MITIYFQHDAPWSLYVVLDEGGIVVHVGPLLLGVEWSSAVEARR